MQPDTPAGARQQANWKWCSKCQGLTYAMPTRPSDGSYPVNGERLIHEFTHACQIQHNSFVPGFVSSGIVNQGASIMGDDVYEHGLPGAPWASDLPGRHSRRPLTHCEHTPVPGLLGLLACR